ncbi:syndecan-3-like [Patiria miniata]|uniref:Neurexin/syndecan/glycophorin C domain-containing protein n=1 Tax=Patiria miniata TaxID=46514 RepID=A0A913ZIH3_PATMI|nr:syndecan-3-like [Patiria miniata]
MYIDGSSGDGAEPDGGETPDDEDNTDAPAELGSGTDRPGTKVAAPVKPSFDNTMRIMKISNKKAVFVEEYNDPNSIQSMQVFGQVCSVLTYRLQQNQLTSMTESCVGVSITSGSLVVKTKITFPEDAAVTSTDLETAIQEGLNDRALTDGSVTLNVDPQSIAVAPSSTEPEPTSEGEPSVPATKKPKPVKPDTASTARPNKGNPDNDIFFPTTMTAKPQPGDGKTTMSNSINDDVNHNNQLGVKDEKEKEQNFFEMILSNPVLLAALVGAVVLTLITIILIIMFMIYRVKKKDEGSYSLDEPHKVKDPTTYWKDTKEFYA